MTGSALTRTIPAWLAAFLLATGSGAQESDEAVRIDDRMWALATTGGAVPWAEAEEHCDTLEAGGFSDWRLPLLHELEALHDPNADGGLPAPLSLEDCCAWSAQNFAELSAERKGELPDPGGPPAGYYWGFLFDGGISYYSNGRFPDGLGLCVRDIA